MRRIVNRLVPTTVLLSILLGAVFSETASMLRPSVSPTVLSGDERVTATVTTNNGFWRIDWRIEKPDVKQRMTRYDQIHFIGGDRITIQAGGCVQTGGHGSTWKRYVNPSGPNADRLYHGLIWIPGVTGARTQWAAPPGASSQKADLKRISGFVNRTFPAPPDINVEPNIPNLILGYEDDGYGDNGYYDHDDGTDDQCKGVSNAYVIVSIERRLPLGSVISGTASANATYGYFFQKTGAPNPGGAFVRNQAAVTGRYDCACAKGGETCEMVIAGVGSISCKPGTSSPYQKPCSTSCVIEPTSSR